MIEKIEMVAGRISDRVEDFVTHLGGDGQWAGSEDEIDLSRPASFNPWKKLTKILNSPSGQATTTVGTVMVGYLAIHEVEVRLLGSSFLSQIIPIFILTPGK